MQGELLLSHYVSCRQKGFGTTQAEFYIGQNLAARILADDVQYLLGKWQSAHVHASGLLRLQTSELGYVLCHDSLAVHQYGDQSFHIVHAAEEVLVVHFCHARLHVQALYPIVLLVMTEFVGMGVRCAVGLQYAIAVEVVVGCRIASVITAEHPYLFAGTLAHAPHTLVDEIPYESSLIVGIFAYELPVFLEVASAVSHGMCILTLDEGTWIAAFAVFLTFVGLIVHGAEHFCLSVLPHLLILNNS